MNISMNLLAMLQLLPWATLIDMILKMYRQNIKI